MGSDYVNTPKHGFTLGANGLLRMDTQVAVTSRIDNKMRYQSTNQVQLIRSRVETIASNEDYYREFQSTTNQILEERHQQFLQLKEQTQKKQESVKGHYFQYPQGSEMWEAKRSL